MIPHGTFKVGDYTCYVCEIRTPYADVMLADTYNILQAERAASSVAKRLRSGDIQLVRIDNPRSSARYGCRINNVKLKEIETWLK